MEEGKKRKKLHSFEVGLLGLGNGIGFVMVTAPIDRIKILLQCEGELLRQGPMNQSFRGMLHCTQRVLICEGFSALWRGNLACCLTFLPTAFLYPLKDVSKQVLPSVDRNSGVIRRFATNVAAGSLGAVAFNALTYPLSFARTKLAVDVKGRSDTSLGPYQHRGMLDVYTSTYRKDGIRGIYRGFLASCAASIVYLGATLGLFDTARVLLSIDDRKLSLVLLSTGCSFAGVFLAYPFDTVMRRLMVTSGSTIQYTGGVDCARHILKNEGVMALWRGATLSIASYTVAAVTLVFYTRLKRAYTEWRLK